MLGREGGEGPEVLWIITITNTIAAVTGLTFAAWKLHFDAGYMRYFI